MDKSLSDSDIRAHGIKNVIKYEDLVHITPQNLLDMMPVVLLYQVVSKDEGHWTLLHKTCEGIEFFDSLGFKPDGEFDFIKPSMQVTHILARKLLYDLSKMVTINYSPYKLQKEDSNIATCGRWCIVRFMYGNCGIDKFANSIYGVCQKSGISPDQLVVNLT